MKDQSTLLRYSMPEALRSVAGRHVRSRYMCQATRAPAQRSTQAANHRPSTASPEW